MKAEQLALSKVKKTELMSQMLMASRQTTFESLARLEGLGVKDEEVQGMVSPEFSDQLVIYGP